MKFFLISDNVDTVTGMRLAGIEGVVVHEAQEPDRHADMDVTASISRYVQEAIGIKL